MEINIIGLDKLIKNLDNYVKYNNVASSRALNRVASGATNKAIRRTIDKDGVGWQIRYSDMKKTTKGSKKANRTTEEYIFIISSKSIYLDKFIKDLPSAYRSSRTPTNKKRNKSKVGVKYKINKIRGTKTLNKSFMKKSLFDGGAFRVFTRRPSPTGNSEITAQASITPTSMFKQEGYEVFLDFFKKNFQNRYFHELNHLGAFKK